jgi:hypothetical protein
MCEGYYTLHDDIHIQDVENLKLYVLVCVFTCMSNSAYRHIPAEEYCMYSKISLT